MSGQIATLWSKAEREAWRLPEELTVSHWADKHRQLPADSAEPGPYRLARTPWAKGPMDAFSDPEVELIDLMWPRQISKSTSVQNMIGYAIDQDPGPTLYVVPREKDVVDRSQKIFRPMLEDSAALSRHITASPRDLQTESFTLNRMTLYFGWAGSPAELKQRAIKYLFFDEPDSYPPFSGKEADPISLATHCTTTFWDRKIVKVCTPRTKNDYIWQSYSLSNQQQYYIACPHCGEYSVWEFGQLKIPKNLRDPDTIRKNRGVVWYECKLCKKRTEETQKEELVAQGVWVAEGERINKQGEISGNPKKDKRHSGFHVTALISPWLSWTEIMARWFEANTEEGIALGRLFDFKTEILAQPWEETGRAVKANELEKRRGDFSRGTVPDDCLVLVAGADYHEDQFGNKRIDYEVRGFGYGLRNWVISSGSADSWEELEDEVLLSPFPWANPEGPNKDKPELAVIQIFVDSGYKPEEVYGFCIGHAGVAMPTKGSSHAQRTPLVLSNLEKASQGRAKRYRGMQLMMIDPAFFKEQVTGWAEKEAGQAGSTEYYAEIPDVYFTEFCNERKVKMRDKWGREHWVWRPVKTGAPTHFLDTAVNAAAAAFFRRIQYLRKPDEKRAVAAVEQQKTTEKTSRRRRPREGFLDDLPTLTFK